MFTKYTNQAHIYIYMHTVRTYTRYLVDNTGIYMHIHGYIHATNLDGNVSAF